MNADNEAEQERVWGVLFDRIREILQQFGKEDPFGKADYLVVDDNYGSHRHTVEIHSLRMLEPRIANLLRHLLDDFPQWEIVVAVDMPGKEGVWPPMGLTIRKHEIVDGLRRDYLPQEYRSLEYAGSRPGTGYD